MERIEKKENNMIRFVRSRRMRDARCKTQFVENRFRTNSTSVFAPCVHNFCIVMQYFFFALSLLCTFRIFLLNYFLDFQYFGSAECSLFLFSTHDRIIIISSRLLSSFSYGWVSLSVEIAEHWIECVCISIYFAISIFIEWSVLVFSFLSACSISKNWVNQTS